MLKVLFPATKDIDSAIEAAKIDVLGLLKQNVRPEFLNRVDETVVFHPLGQEHIKNIASIQLQRLEKRLNEKANI